MDFQDSIAVYTSSMCFGRFLIPEGTFPFFGVGVLGMEGVVLVVATGGLGSD